MINPPSKLKMTADEALARLKEGNIRFLSDNNRTPKLQANILEQQAIAQEPYATILACSDSRSPPELIFDAWLGELFVIRVAGNVLGQSILGTLQYASWYLHTPVFVVMGHEGCGAVKAAIEYRHNGVGQPAQIEALLHNILPALEEIDLTSQSKDVLDQSIEANVRHTVRELRELPEGKLRISQGFKIVGAIYEITTGQVRFLDESKYLNF